MEKTSSDELAYERTRIASERTLMAWVRTAVSLIGFGFTIPKFLSLAAGNQVIKGAPGVSPSLLGVVLIALGTIGLLGGIVEHVKLVTRLSPTGRRRDALSFAFFTAVVVGMIGLLTFVNIMFA